jgi:hypothetical protein
VAGFGFECEEKKKKKERSYKWGWGGSVTFCFKALWQFDIVQWVYTVQCFHAHNKVLFLC